MYIPTALTQRESYALRRYAKDRTVVEAGALLGYSTIQLASTARLVTSIDRHTGYDGKPNDTYRQYRRNLDVAGLTKRVTPIVGDCSLLNTYPADFCFIDLCGTFEVTLAAIQMARAPLVGVHDFQRQSCRGVGLAVSGYQVVERVDSLIILEKPNGQLRRAGGCSYNDRRGSAR